MAKKQQIQIKRDEDFSELDEEMDEALQRLEGTNGKVAHLLERYAEEGEAAIARFLGEEESGPQDEDAASAAPASHEIGEAGAENELDEPPSEANKAATQRRETES
ncbi:MAG: hypothetical protein ACLFV4_04875 [Candidatus Hydrogenedentota bacterium]